MYIHSYIHTYYVCDRKNQRESLIQMNIHATLSTIIPTNRVEACQCVRGLIIQHTK